MDRSSDRSHILKLPKWLIFLRGAQLLIALLVFCLACYGASAFAIDGDSLSLFTVCPSYTSLQTSADTTQSLATFILLTYIVGSELYFPQFYNYWAVLSLEIFAVFFWLVSFALLASELDGSGIGAGDINEDGCFWFGCPLKRKREIVKRSGNNFFNAMATEAAFGGVDLYVPFLTTLPESNTY